MHPSTLDPYAIKSVLEGWFTLVMWIITAGGALYAILKAHGNGSRLDGHGKQMDDLRDKLVDVAAKTTPPEVVAALAAIGATQPQAPAPAPVNGGDVSPGTIPPLTGAPEPAPENVTQILNRSVLPDIPGAAPVAGDDHPVDSE